LKQLDHAMTTQSSTSHSMQMEDRIIEYQRNLELRMKVEMDNQVLLSEYYAMNMKYPQLTMLTASTIQRT
jgi:hypothetical protein